MKKTILIATLSVAGALVFVGTAGAQVAGSSTKVGVTVIESSQLALGWSVNKSILGKAVYNDAGDKIGKVDDVIIAPDKSVSFLIVGTGGFIGIGRHDVAIPVTQIIEQDSKLVLPGASKDAVKAMPQFEYASDTTKHEKFVAKAEQDLAKAKEKLAEIQKKSATVTGEAKVKMDQQIIVLQKDLKAAEDKLAEMKRAGAKRWKEFESGVNKTMARMKQSLEDASK
ncbi:MAG: PRC-barrel domain-containing protein [Undibacterium sp.]|uniref:PRC-barrel domain-containing protein n=1 Tax=Undibacterium sp. TaxID=1914977 RepID=UPI002720AA28|nr:PRC-barrel domain-containing protein [Undibacterium sp.]MDO8653064.1 PRC-barrel domain-containing protein [Undibacterium sp.]